MTTTRRRPLARPSSLAEAYRFALGDTRAVRDELLRSRMGRIVAVAIVIALLGMAAFLVVQWAGWT